MTFKSLLYIYIYIYVYKVLIQYWKRSHITLCVVNLCHIWFWGWRLEICVSKAYWIYGDYTYLLFATIFSCFDANNFVFYHSFSDFLAFKRSCALPYSDITIKINHLKCCPTGFMYMRISLVCLHSKFVLTSSQLMLNSLGMHIFIRNVLSLVTCPPSLNDS